MKIKYHEVLKMKVGPNMFALVHFELMFTGEIDQLTPTEVFSSQQRI